MSVVCAIRPYAHDQLKMLTLLQLGDPNDGFIKARLSLQAEVNKWGINYLVAKITEKESPPFRRVVNLLSGITGVALRLDSNDLTKVFPTMVREAPFSTLQVRCVGSTTLFSSPCVISFDSALI